MKMIQKYILFCTACIICIFYIQYIQADMLVKAYSYPTIIPYVNDFAHTLTQDQVNLLNQHCDEIEKNTSYEIAIVAVNTTDGEDRLEYANHVGQNNGVGKKATGSGLVVLWTMDNEKGLAIATARGAGEIYVNDAKAGAIARAARPLFDEGKYYEGFEQILTQLEQTIKERDTNATGSTSTQQSGSSTNEIIIILIAFGFIGFIVYMIIRKAGFIGSGGFSGIGNIGTGSGSGSFGGGGFGGASFGGGGGKG